MHVRTTRKRLRRSLTAVAEWCQRHRHAPVDEQQKTLNAKLGGHYQYYGRATDTQSLLKFYRGVVRIWRKWLNRRTRGVASSTNIPGARWEAVSWTDAEGTSVSSEGRDWPVR